VAVNLSVEDRIEPPTPEEIDAWNKLKAAYERGELNQMQRKLVEFRLDAEAVLLFGRYGSK